MIWSSRRGEREQRPVPEPDEGVPDAALVGSGLGNVGDLDWLAHLGCPPHESLALPKRRRPEGLDEIRVVVVGRAQLEMLGRLVVLVDRAAGIPDQLTGARDDRVEHRLDVECRTEGLTDLAQRGQLPDRPRQLACPRLQLLEQPHVLDGDDGLVGEGLEQR